MLNAKSVKMTVMLEDGTQIQLNGIVKTLSLINLTENQKFYDRGQEFVIQGHPHHEVNMTLYLIENTQNNLIEIQKLKPTIIDGNRYINIGE